MGIKERQHRDREAVRRAILDAARELFVAEGFQNVSIRKIAERIEYSPAAIYGTSQQRRHLFRSPRRLPALGDPASVRSDPALKNAPPLDRIRAVFWRSTSSAASSLNTRADVRRTVGPAHQPRIRALRVRKGR
jgi:hypothetical protein